MTTPDPVESNGPQDANPSAAKLGRWMLLKSKKELYKS